jgi:hypothetical protein
MKSEIPFLFCGPVPLKAKHNTLKTVIVPVFAIALLLGACSKEKISNIPADTCSTQVDNPSGRTYSSDSVVAVMYSKKNCGIIPLSSKNYWVYEDSIFNDGVLASVQFDTLRFTSTYQSLSDKLIWWQANIQVGLPTMVYANDSSVFSMSERMFTPNTIDAKKDLGLFEGDSLRYLTSFDDAAAQGRSVKMSTPVKTPAATFNDCILYEKNARNYRKDQVYFKPGLGVIRYTQEKAPMGTRTLKVQQVSTLVAFHIE